MMWIPRCLVLAVGTIFPCCVAIANPLPVNLGSASDFAVLAGGGITVAGPANSTTIIGDIGTFPTTTITSAGNILLIGVNHAGDAVTQNAKNDLLSAYNNAAGRSTTLSYSAAFDLGGQSLGPGVYSNPSSFALTGTMTLDAGGDPNAVWIFQAGTTLSLTGASQMVLLGGAQADNVFWQIGTSATLGADSNFVGNLMALDSITVDSNATVNGRILALNAAVTLDNNFINSVNTVPEPGSVLLVGFGLITLVACKQRCLSIT